MTPAAKPRVSDDVVAGMCEAGVNVMVPGRTIRNFARDLRDARAEAAQWRECARALAEHGATVMEYLDKYGGSIVPHLVDTDDNPGQFLRTALSRFAEMDKEAGG